MTSPPECVDESFEIQFILHLLSTSSVSFLRFVRNNLSDRYILLQPPVYFLKSNKHTQPLAKVSKTQLIRYRSKVKRGQFPLL